MDAALGFGGGHALHAVAARLELEARVRALAHHPRDHLLVAARLARALGDDLDLPAVPFGEARVHAEEVAREKRALVAAGAGADLEEQVAIVVRVLRQQHALQVLGERGLARAAGPDLVLGEFLHARVARHLLGGGHVLARAAVLSEGLDHGRDLGTLLRELAELVHVVGGVGVREPRVDLAQARLQARELGGDAVLHGSWPGSAGSGGGKSASSARASDSRSLSPARDNAWVGWWRNLLARPR